MAAVNSTNWRVVLDSTPVGQWAKSKYDVSASMLKHMSGAGTFGVVLPGVTREGIPVAVKLMKLRRGEDRAAWQHELKCARLLQASPHDNVVKVLDIFEDPGNDIAALTMPHASFDLRMLQASHHVLMLPDLCQSIVTDLLRGLTHLHSLGVLHRDLKPANCIMFMSAGGTKLQIADLGQARTEAVAMTAALCTAWYRAPELFVIKVGKRLHRHEAYGRSVDMWSAGMMC
jgi:serine/threonine protein kinase